MIGIRNNIAFLLALPIIFFGLASVAAASEVTGSLSSDGSNEAGSRAIMSETYDNEATGQVATQNSGQIQGSVIGGKEASAAAVFTGSPPEDTVVWMVPMAVALLGVFGYFFWRRMAV